jgi:hypothetical protein
MPDDPKPAENPELLLGPGGVPTPGEPPGPTPTPQEPPAPLKPVGELLGKKDGEAEPKEEPKTPEAPKAPDTAAAGRISQLTAEKWSEKRAREAAEARAKLAEDTLAELARLDPEVAKRIGAPAPQAQPDGVAGPARTYTQAEVQAEARRLAAEGDFNRRVNDAVLAGRAAHSDFDAAIGAMKELTPVIPGDLVAAALETGAPGDVLYALGKDRAEYDRILSMSPIAQAIAVSQLAGRLKAEKELAAQVDRAKCAEGAGNALDTVPAPDVSRASAPVRPTVRGSGRTNGELAIDDPDLPIAEYIKRRNEQEAAARRR